MKTTTFLLIFVVFLVVISHQEEAPKPHIVYILADDYGWANVGYHRDPPTNEIQTPNLDGLVQVGVEIDRHYTMQVCSPSRCSFLAGRNPIFVNVDNNEPDRSNPKDPVSGYQGVPLNMTIIPGKLKMAGYKTHYIGKWDIGMATNRHIPINRGFDTGFGYFHHVNDYWDYTTSPFCNTTLPIDLWENDGPAYAAKSIPGCTQVNQIPGCVYEDDLFLKHALDVIDNHPSKEPLFLYFAPHNTHTPPQMSNALWNKYSFIDNPHRRAYSAMTEHLDTMVGVLVNELKAKGLYNNTLIVFSSDNGGPVYDNGTAGGNNYPLKGGKASNWEGGVRVNAFVSGGFVPSHVRGSKVTGLMGLWDWYATFCALAGVDPFDEPAKAAGLPAVDSFNMWPMIIGANTTSPRAEIFLGTNTNFKTVIQGLISGRHKLLIGRFTMSGWTGPFFPNATVWDADHAFQDCNPGCLFDIYEDPTEHNDLSKSNPTLVQTMAARIKQVQQIAFSPDRGATDPNACKAVIEKYHGFWGPFIQL